MITPLLYFFRSNNFRCCCALADVVLLSESALGLPVGRGSLLCVQRSQAAPAPVEDAMASAKQHAVVAELKRRVLAFGPCASLEWQDFLGPHLLEGEQQLNCMDAWKQQTVKADAKKRRGGWN
eukprot:106058-Amphidinium_carterae.1